MVTERTPMPAIVVAAGLTSNDLIVEFIGDEDSTFRQLLRGRGDLHRDITREYFEIVCGTHFQVLQAEPIPESHRTLYHPPKRYAYGG